MKKIVLLTVLSLFVSSIGYAQDLSKDTLYIDEVVVTGTKVEVSRKNVPLTISVISGKEIEESNETALLPILSERVPGVFVTERGVTGFGVASGSAGQISIRGLGGSPTSQVLILIDGHPQFMGMMGHPLPDAYVASDAERIEIIRGPASILYGSNAMGGVINIITKKQKKDGVNANAKFEYGSFNTQKYMGTLGFKKNKFSVFTSINHNKTDGHRDTSDFQITNAYIKTGYKISDNLDITADFSIAKFNASDPGSISGFAGEKIDILRGKTALSINNNYDKMEGGIMIYENFGEHDISDGWHSNDELFGIMAYQGIKLFNGNIITLGYDYMNYGGKGSPVSTVLRDDNENIIPDTNGFPQFMPSEANNIWTSMTNNAIYSYIQQSVFEKLLISTGIRYEMNSYYGNEYIPQIGFAYHLSNITNFKGSVSRGYRPPTIRELYLFPSANENLEPENMLNYEMNWMQNWLNYKIKTELTCFISNGDNMIVKVPNVSPPPPLYKNTGSFSNKGIEFVWTYKALDNLSFNANYTYINMKEPLIATPEHNLFISGNYKYKKFNFHFKIQSVNNLYGEKQGEITIIEKNYNKLGARINYHPSKYFDIYICAKNLLNQEYQTNYNYPMPGITGFAGINVHF